MLGMVSRRARPRNHVPQFAGAHRSLATPSNFESLLLLILDQSGSARQS
jgi:hypothetical protein